MEGDSYRWIIVASQYFWWVLAHVLYLRYEIRAHHPAGLFEHKREHCLILASSHKSILDPWLIMLGLKYRYFRMLVPVRALATQTFVGKLRWLNWFKPLIKLIYRLAGVIELPPENKSDGFHPEKIRGLLVALNQGDVVAIFPGTDLEKTRTSSWRIRLRCYLPAKEIRCTDSADCRLDGPTTLATPKVLGQIW